MVRASLDGKTLSEINESLASSISSDSVRRWCLLYERTRSVVTDPATYEKRGRALALSEEERIFLLEMVTNDPTIYLEEIQQTLIQQCDI